MGAGVVTPTRIPSVAFANALEQIQLRRVEPFVDAQADEEPPHRHQFHELIWVKEGQGTQEIDDREVVVEPGSVSVISQGQVHYFQEGRRLKGFVLCFSDDFLGPLDRMVGTTDGPIVPGPLTPPLAVTIAEDRRDGFHSLFLRMEEELSEKRTRWIESMRHLVSLVFIEIERATERLHGGTYTIKSSDLFLRFLAILEDDFRMHKDVSHYARVLRVPGTALAACVREGTGKGVKRVILERVILEARRALRHTNAPVKRIALDLGYRDPSYFGRSFRRVTGLSPAEFRLAHSSHGAEVS